MWSSIHNVRKTLNQPSLGNKFDFLGINSCSVWDKFVLCTNKFTIFYQRNKYNFYSKSIQGRPENFIPCHGFVSSSI